MSGGGGSNLLSNPFTTIAAGASAGLAGLGLAGPVAVSNIFGAVNKSSSDAANAEYYQHSLDLQNQTRANILSADIGDEARNQLLSQIDAINTDRGDARFAALKPIIDTLQQKNQLSSQVAKMYQNAVANASKNQSTVITQGGAAAVIPNGNSTVITGGAK